MQKTEVPRDEGFYQGVRERFLLNSMTILVGAGVVRTEVASSFTVREMATTSVSETVEQRIVRYFETAQIKLEESPEEAHIYLRLTAVLAKTLRVPLPQGFQRFSLRVQRAVIKRINNPPPVQ